ncbi:MAG TPA: Hsp20/alpha crystallin family protein [Arenimonas sp.]|uniref:Hsp20/alpha crystallin family protein n=1 Tax=Arenimonas sp. TaxID=1872635 RepID=UPI002D7EC786|nr:Hsp20/alpha crystallin family protein [Arenimonas sp.]HEU0152960.1 Hsp20/alpha crystallin family protein [Arenimonas sp.]
MSLTRYPTTAPRHLQDEIKQVFDKFFNGDDTDASSVVTSQWVPRVDIKEEAERFLILADLPGVDPNAIEVQMDKGILSIKGERQTESVTEGDRYSRVERAHGVFYRRFALPDSANPEGITASGKHGVLAISIPKRPETTPRRIQVM